MFAPFPAMAHGYAATKGEALAHKLPTATTQLYVSSSRDSCHKVTQKGVHNKQNAVFFNVVLRFVSNSGKSKFVYLHRSLFFPTFVSSFKEVQQHEPTRIPTTQYCPCRCCLSWLASTCRNNCNAWRTKPRGGHRERHPSARRRHGRHVHPHARILPQSEGGRCHHRRRHGRPRPSASAPSGGKCLVPSLSQ